MLRTLNPIIIFLTAAMALFSPVALGAEDQPLVHEGTVAAPWLRCSDGLTVRSRARASRRW